MSLGRPSSHHRLLIPLLSPASSGQLGAWHCPGPTVGGVSGPDLASEGGPQQGTQGPPPCWTDNTVSIPEGLLAEQNQLPLRSRLYLWNGPRSLLG